MENLPRVFDRNNVEFIKFPDKSIVASYSLHLFINHNLLSIYFYASFNAKNKKYIEKGIGHTDPYILEYLLKNPDYWKDEMQDFVNFLNKNNVRPRKESK